MNLIPFYLCERSNNKKKCYGKTQYGIYSYFPLLSHLTKLLAVLWMRIRPFCRIRIRIVEKTDPERIQVA